LPVTQRLADKAQPAAEAPTSLSVD
jgi:hypothetical protein